VKEERVTVDLEACPAGVDLTAWTREQLPHLYSYGKEAFSTERMLLPSSAGDVVAS
jgi:hypothetical protein